MKQKLSAIFLWYKGLTVLDWVRMILMILIGLSAMAFCEPIKGGIELLFADTYPTLIPGMESDFIATLILIAVEAALFIYLSKNVFHWICSLIPQIIVLASLLLWGLVTGGVLGFLLMGYFYFFPIAQSMLVQLVAVGLKELLKRKLPKLTYPICYGLCLLLMLGAAVRLFTLPTPERLCKELNEVLQESELIDLKWSYFGDNELERIPNEQWRTILPNIHAETERQPDMRGGSGESMSMGFYSDSHKPFGPSVHISWYEVGGYFRINYRGSTFYAYDSAFVEAIEEYYTVKGQ